jgi:hypothetical protein
MNTTLPREVRVIMAGLALLALASCASMHPITSTPPIPKIVLKAPFDVKAWAGYLPPIPFHVILPPGEYRPVSEDGQSYYYQAPSKVVVNELVSSMFDGGIYVARGSTTPTGWYYNDPTVDTSQESSLKWGAFKTLPPAK